MESFVLYGSGGHAKVVLECLISNGEKVEGLFDDDPKVALFKDIPVYAEYDLNVNSNSKIIITVGNNKIRKQISLKVSHPFGKTVYLKNIISPSAKISEGSMILQGAILNADCIIGKHVIVNTAAIVEHDCIVEDFVHIAPGAVVCGNCRIGEGTLIGANAVIGPNITIGKWCQVSAGSAVTENIPDFSLVMGVPAKIIKTL